MTSQRSLKRKETDGSVASMCAPLALVNPEIILHPDDPRRKRAKIEPIDVVRVEEELTDKMAIPGNFLTEEEEDILDEFCSDIARIRRLNDRDASKEFAVKFLLARKFDPGRAFELYQSYRAVRQRYNMDKLKPTEDPLYSELASGKFTFMEREGDGHGEAIAVFNASLYKTPTTEESAQLLIQCLLFNIDEALRSFSTIACGVTILINVKGVVPGKLDRLVAMKMLILLQDRYPARVKRVFIIDTPWYIRQVFRFASRFLKQKLRQRVFLVTSDGLHKHISPEVLPVSLGGKRLTNHSKWLTDAIHHYEFLTGSRPYAKSNSAVFQGRYSRAPTATQSAEVRSPQTPRTTPSKAKKAKSRNLVTPVTSTGNVHLSPVTEDNPSTRRNSSVEPSRRVVVEKDPVTYLRALHTLNGMPLEELYQLLSPDHANHLFDEFCEIQAAPLHGSCSESLEAHNLSKNLFADILCMDETRVKLDPVYQSSGEPVVGSDYIHANFVGGIHQPAAYILTQHPMTSTVGDFWRMIWEQEVKVVVMCNNLEEGPGNGYHQYWPSADSVVRLADFSLRVAHTDTKPHWIRRTISIRKASGGVSRQLSHFQLTSWSDKGSVKSTVPMVQVMLDMHRCNEQKDTCSSKRCAGSQTSGLIIPSTDRVSRYSVPNDTSSVVLDRLELMKATTTNPPILVHCSSGVGRSAALVATDICCIALMQGMADVAGTVCRLREQRAQSVKAFAHYKFIYQAVVQFGHLLAGAGEKDDFLDQLLNDLPNAYSTSWNVRESFSFASRHTSNASRSPASRSPMASTPTVEVASRSPASRSPMTSTPTVEVASRSPMASTPTVEVSNRRLDFNGLASPIITLQTDVLEEEV